MVEIASMTSALKNNSISPDFPNHVSFGAHRHADRPASAVQAGASTMPAAWETRGVSSIGAVRNRDIPVRTIADIALDPLRWMISTKIHQAGTAVLVLGVIVFGLF